MFTIAKEWRHKGERGEGRTQHARTHLETVRAAAVAETLLALLELLEETEAPRDCESASTLRTK